MIDSIFQKYVNSDYTVCTDTRNIIPNSIFFALKGESFDGNKFAREALKKGAGYAVIDNPEYQSDQTILVDDTLKALQELAVYYRKNQNFTVLALTGTNGKTTTKELIFQVLKTKFNCHATAGNYNNHIGVPLTILSARPDTELLIVEMGANHVGEIKNLCEIAYPNLGLITNIGKAHLEGFGGYQGVIKAKSEMYTHLISNKGGIFYNDNDSLLESLLDGYENTFKYGSEDSGCSAIQTVFDQGIIVQIKIEKNIYTINSNLFGDYNVTNILAAIRIGCYFNIKPVQITDAISNYIPTNNRSQIKNTSKHNTLIIDSYNANPSSMKAALDSFKEIKASKKILILGSMKELGEATRVEHQNLLTLAQELNVDKTMLVGQEFTHCFFNNSEILFKNTEELINAVKSSNLADSLILIKGSRSNKLESVIEYL